MGHFEVDFLDGLFALAELVGRALRDGSVDQQVKAGLGCEYSLRIQVFL